MPSNTNFLQPCKVDLLKKKRPAFSLGKRFNPAADRTSKPGPGAYISEKVCNIEHLLSCCLWK